MGQQSDDFDLGRQVDLEHEKLRNSVRLEEYKSLRAEINDIVKEKGRLQTTILIGLAAYYGWIVTRFQSMACGLLNESVTYILFSVPVCLVALALWRTLNDGVSIGLIAKYLARYEQTLEPTAGARGRRLPDVGKASHRSA